MVCRHVDSSSFICPVFEVPVWDSCLYPTTVEMNGILSLVITALKSNQIQQQRLFSETMLMLLPIIHRTHCQQLELFLWWKLVPLKTVHSDVCRFSNSTVPVTLERHATVEFLNTIFISDARVMALGMAMSVVGLQRVGKSETREFWKFAQFQLKKITSYLSYLKM